MDRLEKVMRVRSERQGSFVYKCLACGGKWEPLSGGGDDGEVMLKMICPRGCNKPEGYDKEETRLWEEWLEEHEGDFNEFLTRAKEAEGVNDSEEGLEEYEANLRERWESETFETREAYVDELMAEWLEDKMLS